MITAWAVFVIKGRIPASGKDLLACSWAERESQSSPAAKEIPLVICGFVETSKKAGLNCSVKSVKDSLRVFSKTSRKSALFWLNIIMIYLSRKSLVSSISLFSGSLIDLSQRPPSAKTVASWPSFGSKKVWNWKFSSFSTPCLTVDMMDWMVSYVTEWVNGNLQDEFHSQIRIFKRKSWGV